MKLFHSRRGRPLRPPGCPGSTNVAQYPDGKLRASTFRFVARASSRIMGRTVTAGRAVPADEQRAYDDGAPLYLARAQAIKRKGDAKGYAPRPAPAPQPPAPTPQSPGPAPTPAGVTSAAAARVSLRAELRRHCSVWRAAKLGDIREERDGPSHFADGCRAAATHPSRAFAARPRVPRRPLPSARSARKHWTPRPTARLTHDCGRRQ